MRLRGILEYLGTGWAGWQVQQGQRTIQGELEHALSVIAAAPVRVFSAGRTDAGVHATGQVITFNIDDSHSNLRRLRRSINALTHDSLCVVSLERCNDAFDPRRHALSRSYEYIICNDRPPSPFLVDRSWHVNRPLDVALLQRIAALVPGQRDFSAFRATDCVSLSTVRFVSSSTWTRDGKFLFYRVTANAFLKQMVRNLVGSMVDVGLGRLPEQRFVDLLSDGGTRTDAGCTAPPSGLAMVHVEYPEGFDDPSEDRDDPDDE